MAPGLWLALALWHGSLSFAEADAFQNQFRDVASDLRCPTCVGLSVLESDAPFSKQIKEEVTIQLKAGKSHEEILSFFTERYGPWILRVPPKTGVSVLAWAIPLLVLVMGPLVVWLLVWRRRDNLVGVEAVKPLEEILTEWTNDITKVKAGAAIRLATELGVTKGEKA